MIRRIKLWTEANQKSLFAESFIELDPRAREDALSAKIPIALAPFHQTDAGPKFGRHRMSLDNWSLR
jgi:hypothetical protein